MAAQVEVISEKLNNVSIVENGIENGKSDDYWGFPLFDAYRMAVKFYKENDGKGTFSMNYEEKVYLSALTKQVTHGPITEQPQLPDIGFLDMFGNDRRKIWASLGDISSNDARRKFIGRLEQSVPVFAPFMIAHQKEKEEKERIRREEEAERLKLEEEKKKKEEEEQKRQKEIEEQAKQQERLKQEQDKQKEQIMTALNAQTRVQFQQYAAQQHPGNPEQQSLLIQHLQEQHYQQYMQYYLQEQQKQHPAPPPGHPEEPVTKQEESETETEDDDVSQSSIPRIAEPSAWTRPQLDEFKQQIKRDPESVISVGRGEVVTIRVPTHEEGAYVFWEFATDAYDLGFGVYFEWTDSNGEQGVSVQIGDSTDDETDEDIGDLERGAQADQRPPVDEVVPVYRRDCHTEVHAGSHRYPGRGVYLLKFDNSYSLWRSKTLYYRVYYTR